MAEQRRHREPVGQRADHRRLGEGADVADPVVDVLLSQRATKKTTVTNASRPVASSFILPQGAVAARGRAADITSIGATLPARSSADRGDHQIEPGVGPRSRARPADDLRWSAGGVPGDPWPPWRHARRPFRERSTNVTVTPPKIGGGRRQPDARCGSRSTTKRRRCPHGQLLGRGRPPPRAELAVRGERGPDLQAVLRRRIVQRNEAEQPRHDDGRRHRPPSGRCRQRGDVEPAPDHAGVALPRRQRWAERGSVGEACSDEVIAADAEQLLVAASCPWPGRDQRRRVRSSSANRPSPAAHGGPSPPAALPSEGGSRRPERTAADAMAHSTRMST